MSYETERVGEIAKSIGLLCVTMSLTAGLYSCGQNTSKPRKAYFSDEETLIIETSQGTKNYLLRQMDGSYLNIIDVQSQEREDFEIKQLRYKEGLEAKTNRFRPEGERE